MTTHKQIPELIGGLQQPLQALEKHLLDRQSLIEGWFRNQWRKTAPPIYASVDLRNAGFKLAPVDTNLFPAGFNNLNPNFLPLCIQAAQTVLEQLMPGCTRILIIPENHTRNPFYFQSLVALQNILIKAGFEVRIGSLLEDLKAPKKVELESGHEIYLEPVMRVGDRIQVENFSPCLVLLNNDLATGLPAILENIKQPIYPPSCLGWATRTKSGHFKLYSEVVDEFCKIAEIDPWFINAYFRSCKNVNFLKREGEQELMEQTSELLNDIQKKYDFYNIKQKPYIVIKAESGTYGMGVLIVHSAEEIAKLNRKKRTEMVMAKGNREITEVILQEGVYTFETWQGSAAEPVVYMFGQYVIGGFFRVHTSRGVTDNLNAPGMHFAPLPFVEACNNPLKTNLFYAYGVIARLALVAAAREQKNALGTSKL